VQDVQATEGEGAISLTEFWKNINIEQAIKNVRSCIKYDEGCVGICSFLLPK
jgi:hypothetical protein